MIENITTGNFYNISNFNSYDISTLAENKIICSGRKKPQNHYGGAYFDENVC